MAQILSRLFFGNSYSGGRYPITNKFGEGRGWIKIIPDLNHQNKTEPEGSVLFWWAILDSNQ